jgi:hypothetical protein
MSPRVIIWDLFNDKIGKLDIRCVNCSFWFDCDSESLLEAISSLKNISEIIDLLKRKLFEKNYNKTSQEKLAVFQNKGGIVKGAFKGKKCIGILFAGDYLLFPKLKSFKVFPPDKKSIFLGCIYVVPDQRDLGIEKRLLIELEKDLLKKKVDSIETIAKRPNDDIGEDEFEKSPLISFKFLINNGFYLRKNDEYYPLLRMDLHSIAKDFVKEELTLEKIAYKKAVRNPVIIKQK